MRVYSILSRIIEQTGPVPAVCIWQNAQGWALRCATIEIGRRRTPVLRWHLPLRRDKSMAHLRCLALELGGALIYGRRLTPAQMAQVIPWAVRASAGMPEDLQRVSLDAVAQCYDDIDPDELVWPDAAQQWQRWRY